MLGRQLRILGRRGSKGEAWTEENRKLGRRREDRERRDGELLSRVRMRSAAAGRRTGTVSFFYQSSKHVFFGSKKHSGMFFQIVQQPKDSVTALKSLIVPILTKHTKVE